ncbi:hypothetical protein GPL02_13700 [Clostridium sp. MCC334]|nr:hypothetical protein [Clostridium sp. MCC334]
MQEFIFIYMLYALLTYAVLLLTSGVNIKGRQSTYLVFFLIIINSLIACLRPEQVADTNMYNMAYDTSVSIISKLTVNSVSDLFANRSYYSIEIVYIFFMSLFRSLFKSPILFYFVSGLLSNALILYGLTLVNQYLYLDFQEESEAKKQRAVIQTYCIYVLYSGIHYTTVAIRSGLAIGLGLAAIGLLLAYKKRLLSMILLVLACLVHTTSILFIGIYLIVRFFPVNLSKKSIAILWIVAMGGYFSNIARYTTMAAIRMVLGLFSILHINAFSSYITDLEFVVQMREGYIMFFIGLFLVITYLPNKRINKLALIIIVGLFLQTFAYPIHALSRLVDIFTIFLIPIVCYSVSNADVKYLNRMVLYGTVFLLVPQYVMIFGR